MLFLCCGMARVRVPGSEVIPVVWLCYIWRRQSYRGDGLFIDEHEIRADEVSIRVRAVVKHRK